MTDGPFHWKTEAAIRDAASEVAQTMKALRRLIEAEERRRELRRSPESDR